MSRASAVRGILSFMLILFLMPLGHAFVVLMGNHLHGETLNIGASLLGGIGIIVAILGSRLRSETMQILTGAFGAILFWGSWVEFIYISYGASLHVPPLLDGSVVITKPEYLMMPTSIPFAVLALIMYVYMARTDWAIIVLIRRLLKIDSSKVGMHIPESIRAFVDLLLLIWWAYLILLVEFDPSLLGDRHPVTMIFATICLICGLILFVRSLRAPTWASAMRQSIVTVCVLWTYIEVLIRLKLFTEVWIYPERYIVQMVLLVVAFVVVLFVIKYLGHRASEHTGS